MSEPRDVSRGPIVVAMCECGHSRLMHSHHGSSRCMTATDRSRNPYRYCECVAFTFDEARTRQVSMDNLTIALAVEVSNHKEDE